MKFNWSTFIFGLLVGILATIAFSAGLYIYQEKQKLTTDEAVANLVEGNDPNAMDKLAASEMSKGTTTATNEPDSKTQVLLDEGGFTYKEDPNKDLLKIDFNSLSVDEKAGYFEMDEAIAFVVAKQWGVDSDKVNVGNLGVYEAHEDDDVYKYETTVNYGDKCSIVNIYATVTDHEPKKLTMTEC